MKLRALIHLIEVDQNKAIEELTEIAFAKALPDNKECDPSAHTAYRSVVGQINWLQSRTQFHTCYKCSRSASALAKSPIADVKALNKLVRSLRAQFVTLRFWSLRGPLRLVAIPDAAYRNNPDKSSQRGHVIFMAEPRERSRHILDHWLILNRTKSIEQHFRPQLPNCTPV